MLWNASAMKGYAVEATDGLVGHVDDFLFSDADWTVRSLVVAAGGWLDADVVRLPAAALGTPDVARREIPLKLTLAEVRAHANPGTDPDPLLRGLDDMVGDPVHATDGDIGHVEDLLVDDDGWSIRYLVVEAGHWWAGNKVLLVPGAVQAVDAEQGRVVVGVTQAQVKASPPYDPGATVDRGYEKALHGYYGWTAYF